MVKVFRALYINVLAFLLNQNLKNLYFCLQFWGPMGQLACRFVWTIVCSLITSHFKLKTDSIGIFQARKLFLFCQMALIYLINNRGLVRFLYLNINLVIRIPWQKRYNIIHIKLCIFWFYWVIFFIKNSSRVKTLRGQRGQKRW